MIDLQKFAAIRDAVHEARGPLSFFALFLLQDTDQWDVIVSGPRIGEDNFDDLKLVSNEVGRGLTPDEMREIGRIVIFDGDYEPLQNLLAEDLDEVKPRVKTDFVFSRRQVAQAYIFTAHRPQLVGAR